MILLVGPDTKDDWKLLSRKINPRQPILLSVAGITDLSKMAFDSRRTFYSLSIVVSIYWLRPMGLRNAPITLFTDMS